MNAKKVLPIILLVVMAILAIWIRQCNSNSKVANTKTSYKGEKQDQRQGTGARRKQSDQIQPTDNNADGLDRNATKLFFTKHAKCRMKCRKITQQEVKDILLNGEINYKKSQLQDPRGPTYALEGITRDKQRVRIIFAPKKAHVSVVTVIDLENEYECSCS